MAIYVTSDLHGTSLEMLKELLAKASFGENDWLYILGDVIDRHGDGGVSILRWLIDQPNAQLILGNHESMLLYCRWLFEEVTNESLDALSAEKLYRLEHWKKNGAAPTINALKKLLAEDRESLFAIIEYLEEAPLCETVEAGGRSFVLCHSGFKNFDKDRKLSDYEPHEILWCRPTPADHYFDNALTIIGHTPTHYFGERGRAFHADTWIDIDTGVAAGGTPMLLCLDTLEEFYF